MRRILLCGSLLAIGLGASSAAVAKKQDIQAAMAAIFKATQGPDCKKVLEIVAQQVATPDFASVAQQDRLYLYGVGAICASEQKQSDLALHYIHEATRLPEATPDTWMLRLQFEVRIGQWAEAVSTIEIIARDMPDTLNTFEAKYWPYILQQFKKQPDLRRRLLKVLASPTYVPAAAGVSTDWFRQDYAIILAEAGDKAGVAALVALIDDPEVLMRISVNPRLRETIPENFDARAAVERHMARMREIAAAHTGVIGPQRSVAMDLLKLDKGEEALVTLDAIRPDQNGGDAFSDRADLLHWWWDSKGAAYAMLGRYEEAVVAYSQGKAVSEDGQVNISQALNLASLQLDYGHPADALTTMAPIAAGKVNGSPYGMMVFHTNHGCASFRMGKVDAAKADLAFMVEHFDDGPKMLTSLQLCMGDIDGAAASIIKRLDTDEQRVDALLQLSDYALPPPTAPKDLDAPAFAAVKARADVQAAIARAGGTRKFNISR